MPTSKTLGQAVVSIAALAQLAGCEPECTGSGCAGAFAAARVGVLDGADDSANGFHAPLDAPWQIEGTFALGPDWSVALQAGGLIAGTPDDSAVRVFPLDEPGVQDASIATTTLFSDRSDLQFGASVEPISDLNGDGIQELAVGAPHDQQTDRTRHEGAVWIIDGAQLGEGGERSADENIISIFVGPTAGAEFGRVMAGCRGGDSSAAPALIVAGPLASDDGALVGQVGVLTAATITDARGRVDDAPFDALYSGVSVGARAGTSLDCQNDVTGDGVVDVLIGAPFEDGIREAEGAVYIVSGDALPASGRLSEASSQILRGLVAEHWAGWSISTGDLDGDGFADVAVGAPGASDGRGQVLVWRGATLLTTREPYPDFRISGGGVGDGFGRTVGIDDIDGDGLADLLVGAPRRNPSTDDRPRFFDSGALYIFRGSSDFQTWRPVMEEATADARWAQPQQFLRTGSTIATGDMTGDGAAEIALVHRFAPE